MSLTVRAATPADRDRFLPLFLGLSRFNRAHHPQDDDFQDVLAARSRDAATVLNPQAQRRILLAVDGAAALGYVWASLYQPGPAASNGTMLTGVIAELYVDEGYRGRGIGTALLTAAHDWFHRSGVRRVRVEAFAWNQDALRFYQKHGYGATAVTLMRPLA